MAKKGNNNKYKNNRNFFDTNLANDITYQYYYNVFQQICMSMFEWKNLPDSMDEEYLERILFTNGISALLYDSTRLYINMACTGSGELDIYEKPTKVDCISSGNFNTSRLVYKGKKENAQKTDCILVYSNRTHVPTAQLVDIFIYKLYNLSRIADINIDAQRTPYIITADEESKLSVQNVFTQLEGNELKIVVKKNFEKGSIDALNIRPDFIADKLDEEKRNIWNEALTMLGINNIRDKRERLVSNEAEQNNELINFNLQSFLIPRQTAAKKFNELFELEGEKAVKVQVRSDLENIIKKYESALGIKPKEGEKDDI